MKLIRKQFKYAQEIGKLPNGEHSDSNTPGLFLLKRILGSPLLELLVSS